MFICLEGIAGSGKTTQTKLLADYLKNVKGKEIFISAVYEGERRSVVSDFMNASGIKLERWRGFRSLRIFDKVSSSEVVKTLQARNN